jgi:hypothetical protein
MKCKELHMMLHDVCMGLRTMLCDIYRVTHNAV